MKKKKYFTFDLGLTNALVSLDFELLELDKSNPKKVKFIFEDSQELNEVVAAYWGDRLPINARTLFDNQKMLKNRIYSD